MKLLWYRTRRHLMQRNVVIRSKWLRGEYADAEIDMDKMRARASYGNHDDRFMAANFALWAGNKWTYEIESQHQSVTESPRSTDFQNMAPVLGEDMVSFSDWKKNALSDWE